RALQARPAVLRSAVLQFHDHHARAAHDLRRGDAGVDGTGKLDDSDADRGAGHGTAAPQQLQFLDPAVRVHAAAVVTVRARWGARGRLDHVPAAGAADRGVLPDADLLDPLDG